MYKYKTLYQCLNYIFTNIHMHNLYIYICSVYKLNVHISIFVSEHMLGQRQQAFRHGVPENTWLWWHQKTAIGQLQTSTKTQGLTYNKMSFLAINSGTLHPITYYLVYQLSLSYCGAVSIWKCLAGEKKKKERSERRLS